LRIAGQYAYFTQGRKLSLEQKRDVYHVVVTCMNSGADFVMQTAGFRTLSRNRVKKLVAEIASNTIPLYSWMNCLPASCLSQNQKSGLR
jgi:hypothetical protein